MIQEGATGYDSRGGHKVWFKRGPHGIIGGFKRGQAGLYFRTPVKD